MAEGSLSATVQVYHPQLLSNVIVVVNGNTYRTVHHGVIENALAADLAALLAAGYLAADPRIASQPVSQYGNG